MPIADEGVLAWQEVAPDKRTHQPVGALLAVARHIGMEATGRPLIRHRGTGWAGLVQLLLKGPLVGVARLRLLRDGLYLRPTCYIE